MRHFTDPSDGGTSSMRGIRLEEVESDSGSGSLPAARQSFLARGPRVKRN